MRSFRAGEGARAFDSRPRGLGAIVRTGALFALACLGCESRSRATAAPIASPTTERDAARVYYIGHSLLDHRDSTVPDAPSVMSLVGHFADHVGKPYGFYAHTSIGAPLSLNFTGASVTTGQRDPRALEHMGVLRSHAARYDTFVLTEGVPLDGSLRMEHTHHFAQRFYCEINARRREALGADAPPAEFFVYEGWHHLYASDPDGRYGSPARWDFRARVRRDRDAWRAIARAMSGPHVVGPGVGARIREGVFGARPPCAPGAVVRIIPAGSALAALDETLRDEHAREPFRAEDGRPLVMGDFFQNGYLDWPSTYPLPEAAASRVDVEEVVRTRARVHPSDPPDDIHLGQLGIYYVSLVTYATIYRRRPDDVPTVARVTPALREALSALAWETVRAEPMSGVAAGSDR